MSTRSITTARGGPFASSLTDVSGEPPSTPQLPVPVAMLGVPFDKVTMAETLEIIGQMVALRRPHYLATANVDFAVQALRDVELQRILADADLVLCDGMPLVWASRFLGNALPERVTGSDLVPRLLAESEKRGWRVFFLGGAEASLAKASENVRKQHPNLRLVGAYSPPFRPLLEMDHEDILRRLHEARPDILLVAFGCPKQEKWIRMQFLRSGVPVSIGVGATIDFLAGTVRRAPVWMQKTGLEWVFRLLQEPRRLFRRYVTDLWVFGREILRQWRELRDLRRDREGVTPIALEATAGGGSKIVRFGQRLDAAAVELHRQLWMDLTHTKVHLLADLASVSFIDSTGIGLLVRLQKQRRALDRQMVLVSPTEAVCRALAMMRFDSQFARAENLRAAHDLVRQRTDEACVVMTLDEKGRTEPLAWQGEITASNEDAVWEMTRPYLEMNRKRTEVVIISLKDVRFIDSTGVRLMVRTRKEALKMGLQIRFTEPQPAVQNVLRIVRLEQLLLA